MVSESVAAIRSEDVRVLAGHVGQGKEDLLLRRRRLHRQLVLREAVLVLVLVLMAAGGGGRQAGVARQNGALRQAQPQAQKLRGRGGEDTV